MLFSRYVLLSICTASILHVRVSARYRLAVCLNSIGPNVSLTNRADGCDLLLSGANNTMSAARQDSNHNHHTSCTCISARTPMFSKRRYPSTSWPAASASAQCCSRGGETSYLAVFPGITNGWSRRRRSPRATLSSGTGRMKR